MVLGILNSFVVPLPIDSALLAPGLIIQAAKFGSNYLYTALKSYPGQKVAIEMHSEGRAAPHGLHSPSRIDL